MEPGPWHVPEYGAKDTGYLTDFEPCDASKTNGTAIRGTGRWVLSIVHTESVMAKHISAATRVELDVWPTLVQYT